MYRWIYSNIYARNCTFWITYYEHTIPSSARKKIKVFFFVLVLLVGFLQYTPAHAVRSELLSICPEHVCMQTATSYSREHLPLGELILVAYEGDGVVAAGPATTAPAAATPATPVTGDEADDDLTTHRLPLLSLVLLQLQALDWNKANRNVVTTWNEIVMFICREREYGEACTRETATEMLFVFIFAVAFQIYWLLHVHIRPPKSGTMIYILLKTRVRQWICSEH